jgi:hypothetical protein
VFKRFCRAIWFLIIIIIIIIKLCSFSVGRHLF